jgi:hypothetical protein
MNTPILALGLKTRRADRHSAAQRDLAATDPLARNTSSQPKRGPAMTVKPPAPPPLPDELEHAGRYMATPAPNAGPLPTNRSAMSSPVTGRGPNLLDTEALDLAAHRYGWCVLQVNVRCVKAELEVIKTIAAASVTTRVTPSRVCNTTTAPKGPQFVYLQEEIMAMISPHFKVNGRILMRPRGRSGSWPDYSSTGRTGVTRLLVFAGGYAGECAETPSRGMCPPGGACCA